MKFIKDILVDDCKQIIINDEEGEATFTGVKKMKFAEAWLGTKIHNPILVTTEHKDYTSYLAGSIIIRKVK